MKTRIEHDLLGEKEVPADAYYGIQTLRGIENFQNISGITIGDYPNYVKALAMVKWAAAKANQELEILPDDIANAITRACEEIIGGKLHDQFPVDLIQGKMALITIQIHPRRAAEGEGVAMKVNDRH